MNASETASKIVWCAGEASIQSQLEKTLAAGFDASTLLHQSSQRTVHRVSLENLVLDHAVGDAHRPTSRTTRPTSSLVIKIHHTTTGRHPLRERLKRHLGRSPAAREWKALERLFHLGAPVPRPRAWGRLADGEEIVVSDFIDGERVHDARTETVDALASAIAKLHDAGYRHGDLHLGNLLVVDRKVVLLDLQSARPLRGPRDRLWDLARLELSLGKAGWNPAARQALRDRLGVGDAFEPILRRFLRDHLRGRARRVLRIGRNWQVARFEGLRGLRDASLEEAVLSTLLESSSHEPNIRERRGGRVRIIETKLRDSEGVERSVLIKHIAAGSLRRALGDRLRGSPATRAFRAGQAAGLLSTRAARPLACLEERRFGLPVRGVLVLEKVGDEDLDRVLPSSAEAEHRLAAALGEWLADGHAWGLSHRDLKASNIRVAIRDDSIRFWLIDLEDLSGPAALSDAARLHTLSQLNASLGDEAFGLEARLAALESYQARLPFALGRESAAKAIARRSLARAHRWHGGTRGCGGGESR